MYISQLQWMKLQWNFETSNIFKTTNIIILSIHCIPPPRSTSRYLTLCKCNWTTKFLATRSWITIALRVTITVKLQTIAKLSYTDSYSVSWELQFIKKRLKIELSFMWSGLIVRVSVVSDEFACYKLFESVDKWARDVIIA